MDGMSLVHLLTTHEFWTGAISSGLLTGGLAFLNNRFSDRRKFKHEDKMAERKEGREEDDSLIKAAEEFTQVCTEILVDSVDTEGAFNTIRDFWNNMAGRDDPAADKKIAHGKKVADAQKRMAGPLNRLKLTASNEVCDAATRASTALLAVARMTTEPFAVVAAQKAASDELNRFVNVVRKEIGRSEYTSDQAKNAAYSFLETLRRQTDDFVEQARDEMRAAGFGTTPWDNWQRKTPKAQSPVI